MSDLNITKTRIIEGVWEGVITRGGGRNGETPAVAVTHQGQAISGVTVGDMEGGWVLRVPIPLETISDGVQTYLIIDASTHEEVNSFSLIAGQALAQDIRIEMDLLRAELDLLKRAFRRHCVETGADRG
ncbi:hypothetical protein HJ526_02995 [Donghicola sp. C2-DW-16]|uniref:Uncharacterized protein n=1 Tax=Donghicola mangrovi TaxID=2729614 RepID=A0A850PZ17_9RHOB|nr:hypothetical protein [Donghicola mangrovi]NVO22033.1 hypothetical protein [Donghicola mangrovi]NVO26376.1 hypothetical protein [Donghicola mangrovi]